MAQSMGQVARQYSPEFDKTPVGLPNTGAALANGEFEFADQADVTAVATGGNGDFGYGRNYFRAVVNLKDFAAGTTGSHMTIEAADDAAMTQNLRRVAVQVLPLTVGPYTFVMQGVCPDGARRYARLNLILGTGATATYDAFLSACP